MENNGMNELLTMSVKEMARRVRAGELSPVELLAAHRKRIEEVNPAINAVIATRWPEAEAEARAAQERLAQDRADLPPLFGVPCTIKDTFGVKDLPWAAGVWSRRDLIGAEDATTVERLRRAGAIIMGKTNIPEAAMWCETYNHVYGRTNNPYDLRRGAGGSSGGEGAIVAAAGSPFGLGADVGGSIRMPCAFNGIPGHKPSGGLVPGTGHWPPAHGPLAPYCCYGPMARRVEDLDYILPLLAGPDGKDTSCVQRELKPMSSVDPDRLRVFFFDDNGQAGSSAEMKRAVNLAAGAFAGQKVSVEHWLPEGFQHSLDIWQAGMSQNDEPFLHMLAGGEPISLTRELGKFLIRRGKITFPALATALIERPGQLLQGHNRKFLAEAQEIRARVEAKLGTDGVLICPAFPVPSPRHTWIWRHFLGLGYSGIINVLGLPATVLPIYHRPDGVPVSVQVVAARFNDHLTLAAAKVLEEVFGGWKPIERIEDRA
jgi:fatty acid amide hydrolase 2